MSELVDLAKERRTRSENAQDWTPRDALEFALERLDSGEWDPRMIYIAVQTQPKVNAELGELTSCYDHVAAGGTNLEMIGLLAMHMQKNGLPVSG